MTGTNRAPSLTELSEVRFGLVEAALLVTATVCHRLEADVRVGLTALAAVTAASCAALPARYAVGVALSAWAFLTGFVVHAGGQLTFGAADLDRLGFLLLLGLVAAAAASTVARHATRRQALAARPAPLDPDRTRAGDLLAGARR